MKRYNRRHFLSESARALAAGSLAAAQGCSHPAVSQEQLLDEFTALSAALIGVSRDRLDSSDVRMALYDAARRSDAASLDALLRAVRDRSEDSQERLAASVGAGAQPRVRRLAASIALAWLLGNWYEPASLEHPGRPYGNVVSEEAYRSSWVWRIAQTHPMGVSDVGFGSWSAPPAAVHEFIGDV